ncbi:MAG: 4'-phosphopantetheinyl transferase superfamily protein, partial [Bacteroidota bacterium]|nr:4'-phosphopantetheinyl transferase superfamily protein [Bacteroidota bacterium]
MNIPDHEIHIYSIDSNKFHTDTESLQHILSPDEISKAIRFRFEKDKLNYILFRSSLRKILSLYLNTDPAAISISYSEKGKPFISNSSIKFNLTHSRGLAVYAFNAGNEIGIDTEFKKEIPDAFEIAKRYFSIEENQEFAQLNKDELAISFFNCWTRKEAFLKTFGEGLSFPLADFFVSFRPGSKPQILWIKDREQTINDWSLYEIHIAPD